MTEQLTAELARLREAYGELLMRCTLECQQYEQHLANLDATMRLHRETQQQLAITAAQLRDLEAALLAKIREGALDEADASDFWKPAGWRPDEST
jgi:hypothetical protein